MNDTTPSIVLGRYSLLRKIGHGGMGEVWLTFDPKLQRQVALKVLPARKRDDQEFLLRFEREARAAAALHHPHILPVHDYGQQHMPDGQTVTYLVMSYVANGSLADRLDALARSQQSITEKEALLYLSQIAEAIDYAHSTHIIHRDIKPANMLLREDNWLLLTDFGIARILSDTNSVTETGAFLGSPTYTAPEQAQGNAVPASDIYSLAVVAYQLFAGRVPFIADNPYAVTFQHAFVTPTSPRAHNPALSPEFAEALLRGLAKEPEQRPASATAYVADLRQALEQYPSRVPEASLPPQETEQADDTSTAKLVRKRPSRRKLLLGIGAGVVLVGGGTATYLLSPWGRARGKTNLTKTPTHPSASATSSATNPYVISRESTEPVAFMCWSPIADELVPIDQYGNAFLWHLSLDGQSTSATQVTKAPLGLANIGTPFDWSPDGTKLAVGNASFDQSLNYEMLIYKADFSGTVDNLPATFLLSQLAAQGVGWASNKHLLMVANSFTNINTSILMIGDIQQPGQKPVAVTLNNPLPNILSVTFNAIAVSLQSSTVAIGTANGVLVGKVDTSRSPATWQQIGPLLSVQDDQAGQVSWSADGRYLAAANAPSSDVGGVGIWDATKQYQSVQPAFDTSKIDDQLTCVAWSPDPQTPTLALGGTSGQIYLWQPGTSSAPQRTLFSNMTSPITALSWSRTGKWLAVSYNDDAATIQLWRL